MPEITRSYGIVIKLFFGDRSLMERCFRSFKTERIPQYDYESSEEAERDVLSYLRYYIFERAHSYNNDLNPVVAETKAVA